MRFISGNHAQYFMETFLNEPVPFEYSVRSALLQVLAVDPLAKRGGAVVTSGDSYVAPAQLETFAFSSLDQSQWGRRRGANAQRGW